MEIIFGAILHLIETYVLSSLLMFLVLWSHFERGNSLNPISNENLEELMLSTSEGRSNINVAFMGTVSEYEVLTKYDFFIPDVDVVCQCSCTDRDTLRSCRQDYECDNLNNSTISCTIHIIINTDYYFCNKFYKLSCQAYFTKTKLMKPFKALYLKYQQTLLNLKIISKSNMSKSDEYNVTVTKNVKHILLSPDKVLHISEFAPMQPLPESWYFIEEGSNELQYSNAMNGIEEGNLNKIGWFQYSVRENRLSRVCFWDLKKHLQVNLLDCHSNPPKYEWKLNATYYEIKRVIFFPKNVEKVSELYKDISKISVDLKEDKVKIGRNNPSSVNISLFNATLYPFLFTSTIKDLVLNLTFTKGNGAFNVQITSPHWTDIFSFSTEAREKIIKLHDKNYDSCWVCVSQKSQQLCQMPSLIKCNGRSVTTSTTSALNETFQQEVININVTDFPTNTGSLMSENSSNPDVVIATTTFSTILLVTSLLVIIILRRRRRGNLKTRDATDEMEPLSSNTTTPPPRSTFTKCFNWRRFSKLTEPADRNQLQKQYKEIEEEIEENQRKEYTGIELPQFSWTKKILPLEELYVDLELSKTVNEYEERRGQEMKLEEMFDTVAGDDPVRILVEGGPGYGKTTLCLKLLHDWGGKRVYISSKYKMVFHFELRSYDQNSIEAGLKEECESLGVNGDDGINCIKEYEKETLLILDGFDEMNDNSKRVFLPLLEKKKFPTMCVVVTSRNGMFQVEKEKGQERAGFLRKKKDDFNSLQFWTKRVLIKGVTTDKIELFLSKYFKTDYQGLEQKIHFITKGKMREVFECPLFLILMAMMLEEKKLDNFKSKTTLYKEFFNFFIRRNLIRKRKLSDEEVDIFNESSHNLELIQSVDQLGQLAIDCLCENRLMFEENDVLKYCSDKTILHLGFLIKVLQKKGREDGIFYQPIHKSFFEFAAAFKMWNLFRKDENEFIKEIEGIGEKGIKPTEHSLFFIFLGGLLNSKAYVLFQSLTRYCLWFNIESLCFQNILLEIQDIHSFFPSFQPILNTFIPSFYYINDVKWLTSDYFQSEIHSLILKHSSDRQLIKVLTWNPIFPINISHDLHFDCIWLLLSDVVFNFRSDENKIKCKNIICVFSKYFQTDNWIDFVSLCNSIQSEKVHFKFDVQSNDINSLVFPLLHKELMEGEWKQMNVGRLTFNLNESDNSRSLSLLVDLVKNNRISEGVYLCIHDSAKSENEINFLKRNTEELFNAVIQSKTIKEFSVINHCSNFTPHFDFSETTNPQLNSLYFEGSLNPFISTETTKEKHSVEIMRVYLSSDEMEVNFIKNIQNIRYLECQLNSYKSLIEMEWPGLKEIEELEFDIPDNEQLQHLNSVSYLSNLQVLILDVRFIMTIPLDSKVNLVNLFSSLNLRICQFVFIQNLELFDFITEVVKEGLEKKEGGETNTVSDSIKKKTVHLHELLFLFNHTEMDVNRWKNCNGIRSIRSMLRSKQIEQFCWVDLYNVIRAEEAELLFPSKDNFRICNELDGINPNNSRWNQYEYRWFMLNDRYCITYQTLPIIS